MPTYEYKCVICDERLEIYQSFTENTLETLEGCEVSQSGMHELKKVFHAVGIAFKGEGFYKNDSKSSSSSGSSSASSSKSSDSAEKSTSNESSKADTSDTKKADTKANAQS